MKNRNIKAALFDLDGVVVFTDKYHYLAWKRLADENGWEFDEKVNNRLRGIPRIASLEEILKYNGIDLPYEEKERLADIKNTYYKKLLNELNPSDIYKGSVEFIEELRKRNVKIALCSSSKNAGFVLEKLGLSYLFDKVVTGNDIVNSKPHLEVFLKGAEKLGIPAFHCVVFEDALAGIQAGKAAKMRTVGVGNREETEELADQFITDYSEIDIPVFLESGKIKSYPISETSFVEDNFCLNDVKHIETVFALGNGYMGLRGTYDEEDEIGQINGMYINGIFAVKPYSHPALFKGFAKRDQFTVNLSDWRIINLYVDGEKACFLKHNIKDHFRELDFISGQLKRSFIFETATGKRIRVESRRLVNMDEVHSAEISYTVTPLNFDGELIIESVVVKNTTTFDEVCTKTVSETERDGIYTELLCVPTTKQEVSVSVAHTVDGQVLKTQSEYSAERYKYTVYADLKRNTSVTLNKFAAFAATIDGIDNLTEFSHNIALENAKAGFEVIAKRQKAFWDDYWKTADVKIKGNSADCQAVRFSLFQLRQQLATVNDCSIGATGLTGPQYSGKVFWDTEMYLMPYYNFTFPESQKGLLMYRYRILDKARERAAEFDAPGAMYSWCSIDGEETSVVFEASTAEYHLNSDIAYSIWRYYDSTEDRAFLYDYGAEIVFETAKFMFWRGNFSAARGGRFCLNAVCGPDEYACGVNNNCYTNFMLRFHFEFALKLAKEMQNNAPEKFARLCEKISITEKDFADWKRAADNIYYKYNEQLGIYEQDDSFVYEDEADMSALPMNYDLRGMYHPLDLWRLQVSKQADVVLLNFIQGDRFTKDEKQRCYDYYEPKCNHGSSLSTAIHCIMACELEKPEAYEFFRSTAYMDISDFKKNTGHGLHIACLGGVWMSVVNGYLGMRHYTDGIHFEPRIPKEWEEYTLNFAYKGAVMKITVNAGKAVFELISGESLEFKVYGNSVALNKTSAEYEYSF